MVKVCSWCKRKLTEEIGLPDGKVSHGICPDCLDYFYPRQGKPPTFGMFLDRLAVPVLVVDDDVRVVHANGKASALLGKEPGEIEGRFAGEAVECVHARLPGGCGRTVHCKSCTIRLTVLETHATGRSHFDVPAYLDTASPQGVGCSHFQITTAKSGPFVLLKIAEVPELGLC